MPIVGMARASWNLDKLKERARSSVQNAGDFDAACFAKLAALLRMSMATTRILRPTPN